MSSFLSDNDDDLFDYDPDVEQSLSPQPSVDVDPSLSSSTFFANPVRDENQHQFLNNIKNTFDSDADLDLQQEFSAANSNIYRSFQEAIHSFVVPHANVAFDKSVHMTLDELTNGRFSLLHMFNTCEISLARKSALLTLFQSLFGDSMFDNNEPGHVSFSRFMTETLNISYTELLYHASFSTTIDILNHSVNVDRILYQHLANKLNLPVRDILLTPLSIDDTHAIETTLSSLLLGDFQDKITSSILTALFTPKVDGSPSSLTTALVEAFDAPVEYHSDFRTLN